MSRFAVTCDDTETLRRFEQTVVRPLLTALGAEPIESNSFELTLVPGSIAFLMNNADAYEVDGERLRWKPLTVLYCDARDVKGEVFGFGASVDRRGNGWLDSAEIHGVARLDRHYDAVVWRDPLTKRRLVTLQDSRAIINAWHIFRGAVLPMLYQNTYRFLTEPADRATFQAQVLRQIHVAFEGTL